MIQPQPSRSPTTTLRSTASILTVGFACVLGVTVAAHRPHLDAAGAPAMEAVASRAADERVVPRLVYEHGGVLVDAAASGRWTYVAQAGRIHALDASRSPATIVATSAPLDVALVAVGAADGWVAAVEGQDATSLSTLHIYRHEPSGLVPHGSVQHRVTPTSITVMGNLVWLLD